MARPSRLNRKIIDKIVSAIRAGNFAGAAARYAGISESTFYRWMAIGREEERGLYRELYEQVKVGAKVYVR